jgi:hypothetical protein
MALMYMLWASSLENNFDSERSALKELEAESELVVSGGEIGMDCDGLTSSSVVLSGCRGGKLGNDDGGILSLALRRALSWET